MKIKIIEKYHELDLEDALNAFILNKKIHSMQYQVAMCNREDLEYSFSCLIIYEEILNKSIE